MTLSQLHGLYKVEFKSDGQWYFGNDVERSFRGLFWCTIMEFAWRGCGKSRKASREI